MKVTLYYSCCSVAHVVETLTQYSQATRNTLCWFCGDGFPTPASELDLGHPLLEFQRRARVIQPTDKTPPWRI